MLEINDKNFKTEVEDHKGLVLIDFWAAWCGPCQTSAPILETLNEKMKNEVKVAKLNVDNNQATAGRFGVMSIPTFVFFKDCKEIERKIGVQSEEALTETIKRLTV